MVFSKETLGWAGFGVKRVCCNVVHGSHDVERSCIDSKEQMIRCALETGASFENEQYNRIYIDCL